MISSVHNPLVKQLRQLGESSKHRHRQGQMLLEGTHLIQEAIAVNYPLTIVCYTQTWQNKETDLYHQLLSYKCQMELVADHVLSSIATTLHPDGIVASAPLPSPASLQIKKLALALEGIQDPGNMGTIIRSSKAAGCEGIIVDKNCVDLTNPKILRATAGQWFRSVIKPVDNFLAELAYWQQQGIKVVATGAKAERTFWEYDFSQPSLLVLGNEGKGLSAAVMEIADVCLSIPVAEGVESLNVAMTATLLLYEAKRQFWAGTRLIP